MFKYILEGAGDINWMAIFALITFFTVFGISIYMVFRQDRKFLDRMSKLPLDEEPSANS